MGLLICGKNLRLTTKGAALGDTGSPEVVVEDDEDDAWPFFKSL